MVVREWKEGEDEVIRSVDLLEAAGLVNDAARWDVVENLCGTEVLEDGTVSAWCGRLSSASIRLTPENRLEADWLRDAYKCAWEEWWNRNGCRTWRD